MRSIFNRALSIVNRTVANIGASLHVAMANLWRDHYNPLRGLDIRRAVTLLEAGERGEYAELQWTYRFMEMQDAVLGAAIDRRVAAIKKLDWNIKIRGNVPKELKAQAELQANALRECYEGIQNLKGSWESMVMATFRGYAILEKITDSNGKLVELLDVEQWYWVRQGMNGAWQYNDGGKFGVAKGTDVDTQKLVIREIRRPVNRVALIAFVRKALSQKDWDGFIETYGIPAVFIIMPPDVPKEKESEYLSSAENVVSDARGTLPHGSDIKTVDNGARGVNPFKDHLSYQDEQLVLRATGGKLTMLTASTGLNSDQGDVHEKAFDDLAKAEAADISEIFEKEISQPFLTKHFPKQKLWAYFEIAANEETDTSVIVDDVTKLATAGYEATEQFIHEKTGYEVTKKLMPAVATALAPIIKNRESEGAGFDLFTTLKNLTEEEIVKGFQESETPES